jgi:hypothetical protein
MGQVLDRGAVRNPQTTDAVNAGRQFQYRRQAGTGTGGPRQRAKLYRFAR